MKKSEFIEKLNRIEGDPEIVIWNAYVQDWNGVKELYPHELVRQSFEGYCDEVQLEKQVELRDWEFKLSQKEIVDLKRSYRKHCEWQLDSKDAFEIDDKFKLKKRVVIIEPKKRNIKDFDRLGELEY